MAPNHEHFVNLRLDLDVDGVDNSVLEMNTRGFPTGPGNPVGNAVVVERKVLATERDGRRDLDLKSARKWEVFNPKRTNALGHLTGYTLVPGENALCYAQPGSPMRRRAGFVDHQVWLTRYKRDEIYTGGAYPNQDPGGQGLIRFFGDEPIVDRDLVLWYTFGVMHGPCAEDWPVMSVHRAGFRLTPGGFFSRNPALDVPPPVPVASGGP